MGESKQQFEQEEKEEFLEEDLEATDENIEVIDSSDAELTKLKEEKDEFQQRLLRLQADYDNFRRRTEKERQNDLKYKSQDLIKELLPALDNFERALKVEVQEDSSKSFVEGMEMVYRQLKSALEKEGVEEIAAEGEVFDPHLHQAVMQVQDENYESNVVVEELQKGYQLKDRVIRPAMVKVNE